LTMRRIRFDCRPLRSGRIRSFTRIQIHPGSRTAAKIGLKRSQTPRRVSRGKIPRESKLFSK
jgi:hypothetical protein